MSEEFESQPVPSSHLKSPKSFWGMYAGEHAAGTEFMIGPLFLASGVSAIDLVLGLLLGNLLAVLSWRFLTTPIAVRSRLTLYRQLERIAGRGFVIIYNAANGVLFCFLAGAMVTVSATAVGVPFGMEMPALDAVYPNGALWVGVVLAVGAVFTLIAAAGYDMVSRIANLAVPWMLAIFLACGLVALPQLGIHSIGDFWRVASTEIWKGGEPFPGQVKFTFWHVLFFAWFCNAAMHVGMADLSVLRYAKKESSGWAPAGGMYLGHMICWIAASLLYAVQLKADPANTTVAPGPMAGAAVGIAGILTVVVAGWTTANPTIYRAGLAFQAILPGSPRFAVTCLAGGIATIAGLFPALAMKLLGFVGIYGTILAPVGAVIVVDYWLLPRVGRVSNLAESRRLFVNWTVAVAWGVSLAISYVFFQQGIFPSFLTLPAFLLCGITYLGISLVMQPSIARIAR